MDCDFWGESGTLCSFKIHSVLFSDGHYLCFCDNHQARAYSDTLYYLNQHTTVFIEDDDDYSGWESIAAINRMRKAEIAVAEPESVQALFSCFDVLSREWNGDVTSKVVHMSPAYVPDPANTNHSFWKATPTGSLQMQIDNPSAFQFFKAGKKYLVTFTPVEE